MVGVEEEEKREVGLALLGFQLVLADYRHDPRISRVDRQHFDGDLKVRPDGHFLYLLLAYEAAIKSDAPLSASIWLVLFVRIWVDRETARDHFVATLDPDGRTIAILEREVESR